MSASDYVPAKTAAGMSPPVVRTFNTTSDILNNTKVKDIMVPVSKLIDINAADGVLEAFKRMTSARVLSLPVYDDRRQKYIGFIDIIDIVHHFLESMTQTEIARGFASFKEKFANTKCKEVMDVSGRNPFNPIEDDVPLGAAISMMNEAEAHRLPVVDGGGELVSLLSQSRVVSYLTQHLLKFPSSLLSIDELGLVGAKPVVCVKDTDVTVAAFQTLRQQRVSAVGVVDAQGLLTGVLSVTDLRAVGYDEQLFQRLYMPVGQFLQLALESNPAKPRGVVTVQKRHTLGEVAALLAKTGLHRIYVDDGEQRPIGIVSLTDILKQFAS